MLSLPEPYLEMSGFCWVGDWHLYRHHLVVGTRLRREAFNLAPVPLFAHRVFQEVAEASELRCPLRLVWLESARGRGGFFTPGLVAVGQADQASLADIVFHSYLQPLDPYSAVLAQLRDPSGVYTYKQVARAGIQYVLAHEIGHALQAERAEPMTPIEAECDADTWAGVIAEHLGWDMTLQRHFAHAIGCTGMFCSHPPPEERVDCYARGRAIQRAHILRSLRWGA